MIEKDNLDLQVFENQVNTFETMLRTVFNNLSTNQKYIVIQRVNYECMRLSNTLNTIERIRTTKTLTSFQIEQILTRGRMLVYKYETVRDRGLDLRGDILVEWANLTTKKEKKLENQIKK